VVTKRDQVWVAALRLLEVQRSFTAAEVRDAVEGEPPSERTVRNTLDAMESLDLLGSDGGAGRAPREFYPLPPDDAIQPTGYTPRASTHSSPIPYPGSKGSVAEWIVDIMPTHDTYVEVFGGAAGVLFNKPRSKYEIYNDINDDLTQFFEILRTRPDDLASWLQAVPYSRSQYEQWVEEFYEGVRPDDPVERAGRYFALRYMQYIGISSTANGFKTRARRSPARTFDNARRRIESLADRFDQVIIENQDYEHILTTYNDTSVDVPFYADPPYVGSEGYYQREFDHEAFVDRLTDLENDWIVSYADLPDGLDEYTTVSMDGRHRMKRGSGTVSETLVCNFDPDERTSFSTTISD